MPLTWTVDQPSWILFADGEDLANDDETAQHLSKALAAQYLRVGVGYLNRLVHDGRIVVDHYENDEAGGYKRAYFAREELDRYQVGR